MEWQKKETAEFWELKLGACCIYMYHSPKVSVWYLGCDELMGLAGTELGDDCETAKLLAVEKVSGKLKEMVESIGEFLTK